MLMGGLKFDLEKKIIRMPFSNALHLVENDKKEKRNWLVIIIELV